MALGPVAPTLAKPATPASVLPTPTAATPPPGNPPSPPPSLEPPANVTPTPEAPTNARPPNPDLSFDTRRYFANLDVRLTAKSLPTHHIFERDMMDKSTAALDVLRSPIAPQAQKIQAAKVVLYTAMMMKSTHDGYWAGTIKGDEITPVVGAATPEQDADLVIMDRQQYVLRLLVAAQTVYKDARLAGFIAISQARAEHTRDGLVSDDTFKKVLDLIEQDKVFTLTGAIAGLEGLSSSGVRHVDDGGMLDGDQRRELAAETRGVIRNRMAREIFPFPPNPATPFSTTAPYGREGALVAIGDALIIDLLKSGEWSGIDMGKGQDWKFAQAMYEQAQKGFADTPAERPVWEFTGDLAERIKAIANLKSDIQTHGVHAVRERLEGLFVSERAAQMKSCASCHGSVNR